MDMDPRAHENTVCTAIIIHLTNVIRSVLAIIC